jgi:hypothetical protein
MSTGKSPKIPESGPSGPKQSGSGRASTPETGKTPLPQAEGAADPEQDKKKPDPTRFGDWEKNGRCIDF